MTRRLRRFLVAVAPLLVCYGCASAPAVVEPSFEDKQARTVKLEDERSLGGGELVSRLAEPEAVQRAHAALALGRIGLSETAPALTALLDDPADFVRARAAFALGLLEGPLPEATVSRLVEALDDEAPRVRGRAADALGRKVGLDAAEVIATAVLAHLPPGREPYEWTESLTASELLPAHLDTRLGIFALARLGTVRWSWSVLATQGSTPRFDWWPAAWSASALEGDELAPLFHFYAGSPDPTYRIYGARGLGATSRDQAQGALRQLLYDPNEKVRIEAIRAITRLDLEELLPDVVSRLEADTRYVQVEILKSLAVLDRIESIEPLIDRVGSESPWVRGLALRALARQDPESFWLLLSGLGSDPSWRVRRDIAETLGRIAGDRPDRLLETMLEDSDARVRASALRAFTRRKPDAGVALAIRHLAAEEPLERAAAAEALARLDATDGVAPLTEAFLREKDLAAKAALLEAIASIDLDSAASLARGALDDTEYLIRREAASILRRAGETSVFVRPLPSSRSVEGYRGLLTAPFSPQAFVRTSQGTIAVELFIADAPLTVRNFIELARTDFFDGLAFYDVVPNGLVRTGDPLGDGTGGPGYDIRSEINERPFLRGTLAMDDEVKDTGGSRFAIAHLPRPDFEGRVTVFGQVTEGMEIVDRLEPGDVIEDVTIWDGVTSPYPASADPGDRD